MGFLCSCVAMSIEVNAWFGDGEEWWVVTGRWDVGCGSSWGWRVPNLWYVNGEGTVVGVVGVDGADGGVRGLEMCYGGGGVGTGGLVGSLSV